MRKSIFSLWCLIIFIQISFSQNRSSSSETIYKVIAARQNTFGYEISIHNKVLIRQETIPGLPGIKGFTQKGDAVKVAKLVIKKIRGNIIPPTITRQELDSLQIKIK